MGLADDHGHGGHDHDHHHGHGPDYVRGQQVGVVEGAAPPPPLQQQAGVGVTHGCFTSLLGQELYYSSHAVIKSMIDTCHKHTC